MSKAIAIVVVCSFFLAIQAMSLSQNVKTDLFVGNLTEYLRARPYAKVISNLQQQYGPRQQLTYTLGKRIQGDRVVATSTQSQSWAKPKDVTLSLSYPQNGVGAVLTYAQIDVNQSSNLGRGVVVSGGIGQRQITVAIEAGNTTYFQYNAQLFGY